MHLNRLPEGSPRVAVLTPIWRGSSETAWALRQVAGTLALAADVHVVSTEGATPHSLADGVFTLHELASADRRADLERDMHLGSPEEASSPNSASLDDVLAASVRAPWAAAANHLRHIAPDLVVLADHRQVGAWEAAAAACPGTPILLVPLATAPRVAVHRAFAPFVGRAGAAICFSAGEERLFGDLLEPARTHRVGPPLAGSTDALSEPEPRVKDTPGYLLVLTDAPAGVDDPSLEFFTARFASEPVVVVGPDRCVVRPALGQAPRPSDGPVRHRDLLRLMAWARVTADLHPGLLFGRRSLESLLHGTPIVVPAGSSAREHAETGSAGLWFADRSGLAACTEALLDSEVRTRLGAQGRDYASATYGSTEAFVAGVARALGALHAEKPALGPLVEALPVPGGPVPAASR